MFQAKGAFRLLFFEARAVWVLKRGREDWEGRAGGETAVLINPLSLISARRAGLEGLPFDNQYNPKAYHFCNMASVAKWKSSILSYDSECPLQPKQ